MAAPSPVQGNSSSSSEGTEACTVPTLIDKDFLVEILYTTSLLQAIPEACGCHLQLVSRKASVTWISSLPKSPHRVLLLIADKQGMYGGLQEKEVQAIMAVGEHAKRLIVIHQGDERNRHNISWYPRVKAVFRNYQSDLVQLKPMAQYLQPALQQLATGTNHRMLQAETPPQRHPPGSTVYWFPLGYGKSFVRSPALLMDWRNRPYLWSWTGSTFLKPERAEMLQHMNSSALMPSGWLYAFPHFHSKAQLAPIVYSTMLYESKFVPMPAGNHPEQYRLWECLLAGCIPVVHKQHENGGLAHLSYLGIKALWVDKWADAPIVLQEVQDSSELQAEMAAWPLHNLKVFEVVMQAVQQQLATAICQAYRGAPN